MSRALAQVLAETGFWPTGLSFEARDLVTVLDVMRESRAR